MTASPKTSEQGLPTGAVFPLPPADLAIRIGSSGDNPYASFEKVGRSVRAEIRGALPSDWSFERRRILDFGCGVGRVLRQFAAEAEVADIRGCDIDGPSVDWVNANLSPPFSAVRNEEEPPLPWPDRSFDLILAISVFTHISDHWSKWLCELHRLLDSGGLLLATFLGAGVSQEVAREPWHEDRVGINVLRPGQSWDKGGPSVFLSPWWIREHWGRAFTVEVLRPSGFAQNDDQDSGHGVVLLRKRDLEITPAELERIAPDEPREIQALRHNIAQLQRETIDLERAAEHTRSLLASYESSLSWRLTRPLRRIRSLHRRRAQPR